MVVAGTAQDGGRIFRKQTTLLEGDACAGTWRSVRIDRGRCDYFQFSVFARWSTCFKVCLTRGAAKNGRTTSLQLNSRITKWAFPLRSCSASLLKWGEQQSHACSSTCPRREQLSDPGSLGISQIAPSENDLCGEINTGMLLEWLLLAGPGVEFA